MSPPSIRRGRIILRFTVPKHIGDFPTAFHLHQLKPFLHPAVHNRVSAAGRGIPVISGGGKGESMVQTEFIGHPGLGPEANIGFGNSPRMIGAIPQGRKGNQKQVYLKSGHCDLPCGLRYDIYKSQAASPLFYLPMNSPLKVLKNLYF